ncbi:hypothetical protein NJC10_00055 [Micrococcus sp. M4NT]|uniref:hypothetical protein n=1 Tax=Micrococcus sp. M4NT TaxID=2957501 RepID=UPI0029A18557|nr:hypothetical protein [Micrococcus sp. M4NT]MDX2340075.1 hypothetical protein [Micrococcus sp. M4NT]
MRTVLRITSATLVGVALAASLAAPAGAAVAFEHSGYGGATHGVDNVGKLGAMNDRASSLKTYGRTVNFFEHAYGSGMGLSTSVDHSNLRDYRFPMAPTLTWNDKISSWYTR